MHSSAVDTGKGRTPCVGARPGIRAAALPRRRVCLFSLVSALCTLTTTATADGLQLGGNVGFGMTLRKQAGLFAWDWDSTREDTTLAELKLRYAPVKGLAAFVRFGARLEAPESEEDAPEFALGEASLVLDRAVGRDSLGLRLFARQPSALWLDHGLGAPLDPHALGDDVQGLCAMVHGTHGLLMLLVADGSGGAPSGGDGADEQVFLVRFRADPQAAGLRLGATFLRAETPGTATGAPNRADEIGFDLRACVAGVQAQVDYSAYPNASFGPIAPGGAPMAAGGELADALPADAALRAELRAPRLQIGRWGWFGFAPAYRCIGAEHTNLLVPPLPQLGSPVRGVEGYRLEAWYGLPQWPVWIRQAYDRQRQFRDAARRVIQQESEIEAQLATSAGARLRYVQRQVHDENVGVDAFHDDVLAALHASAGATRLRLQWAALDVNAPARRDAFALEAGLRLSARLQLLGRSTWGREPARQQRSFYAEVQYWHLPQFEVTLQYGAGWIGDRADPALDADVLTAAGRDQVRLHLRGWF